MRDLWCGTVIEKLAAITAASVLMMVFSSIWAAAQGSRLVGESTFIENADATVTIIGPSPDWLRGWENELRSNIPNWYREQARLIVRYGPDVRSEFMHVYESIVGSGPERSRRAFETILARRGTPLPRPKPTTFIENPDGTVMIFGPSPDWLRGWEGELRSAIANWYREQARVIARYGNDARFEFIQVYESIAGSGPDRSKRAFEAIVARRSPPSIPPIRLRNSHVSVCEVAYAEGVGYFRLRLSHPSSYPTMYYLAATLRTSENSRIGLVLPLAKQSATERLAIALTLEISGARFPGIGFLYELINVLADELDNQRNRNVRDWKVTAYNSWAGSFTQDFIVQVLSSNGTPSIQVYAESAQVPEQTIEVSGPAGPCP